MFETGSVLSKEFDYLQDEWRNPSKNSNKIKVFGQRGEFKTDTAGVVDYTNNAYGVAYVHENEKIKLGNKSGWYAGSVYNKFKFKDIGKSQEEQTMIKAGVFKTMSPKKDYNGSLTWKIAGEAFAGRGDMKRRYWIVDEVFEAKGKYTTYGIALKNEIGKEFRTSENTSIRPYGALNLEYGKYSDFRETGPMALKVKGNDYFSAKPEAGISFNYKQDLGVRSKLTASLTAAYENELGELYDVQNKAKLKGTKAPYYKLRGDKENHRGNGKFDLNFGWDNTRFGVTVNAGYDTTGENFRGGIGFRAIY
jgi:fusobacterium outer membrane protein